MRHIVRGALASIVALSALPAWAQDAQVSDEAAASQGDIVVTATRENTLLSKTPIALTAITAEGLRDVAPASGLPPGHRRFGDE